MIDVQVKFHGVIRDITKAQTIELSMPEGSTLHDMLACLHGRYGQPFAERVLDSTLDIKPWVKLFLGETELDFRALATPLGDSGTNVKVMIFVLPASAGG